MALSAKEMAAELGTDARTLRKFLRAHLDKSEQPGQGGRYIFDQEDVATLRKQFEDWGPGKAGPKKKKRHLKSVEDVDEDVDVDDLDVLEDLSDLEEPDDDELEEIGEDELEIDE